MPTLCELKMAIRKLDSKAKITQNKPALEALLKKLQNKGNTPKVQSMLKQVKEGIAKKKSDDEDEDMPMAAMAKKYGGSTKMYVKKNKKK